MEKEQEEQPDEALIEEGASRAEARMLKVPHFTGDEEFPNASGWWNTFANRCRACKIPVHRRLYHLSAHLSGSALEWWSQMPSDIKNNFQAVEIEFHEKYMPSTSTVHPQDLPG